MKFGIHNSSWLDAPDTAEAFEAVKAKAQWAEAHRRAEASSVRAPLLQTSRDSPDRTLNAAIHLDEVVARVVHVDRGPR